jgi:hypothetical protein
VFLQNMPTAMRSWRRRRRALDRTIKRSGLFPSAAAELLPFPPRRICMHGF